MPLLIEGHPALTRQPSVLYEFFRRSAARWPDAVAVDVPPGVGRPGRTTVSYRELQRRSDQLSVAVRHFTGGEGTAAILLSRTTEQLYAAQLAVLQSGRAYVCLDPAFPDEQVEHIIADSGARVMLTDAAGHERLSRMGYPDTIIRVDRPLEWFAAPASAPVRLTPEGIAYIIYTSGTTGQPKGVMIAHHSISNLIESDLLEFGLGPGDRVAQGSSAAYDSSVEEVWMALSSGATVVVMDDNAVRLGPDVVPWLALERITVLCPPPTLLRAAACADPQAELPDLRLLYVGGEALPEDVADWWARGRRMVNGYGPTECTVTCLRHDVVPGQPIAIGLPVPGMWAFVVDENLQPVPDGQSGELCMAGAGLAVGYRNRPELNATKFPNHPSLGRIYRTGDLVNVGADGNLYYQGRIDSQVKLRGYRIELEAIEAYLARCVGVREAACCVQGEGAAETLAAHIVAVDPTQPPAPADLRARLRQALPPYMVPSLFGLARDLPRSASGKLCRTDLPPLPTGVTRGGGRHRKDDHSALDPAQQSIIAAVHKVLGSRRVGLDDDFFEDLGGSSLQAAMLISQPPDRFGNRVAGGTRPLRGADRQRTCPQGQCRRARAARRGGGAGFGGAPG